MALLQSDLKGVDLVELVAPASEPLTTAEAKLHLRVTSSADDTDIDEMIKAARRECEAFCGRQFITATYGLYLPAFPSEIRLPNPPTTAVTWVKYYDTNGTQQTLTVTTDYQINLNAEPARIRPSWGQSWPSVREVYGAVEVKYVTGYADAASVPAEYKRAMKAVIGHLYRNRETRITGTIATEVGDLFRNLLGRDAVIPI